MEVGTEREIIYISLHCHHQNDSCVYGWAAMKAILMFHRPQLYMEVGKREIIYLSLHCHHQNDCCI